MPCEILSSPNIQPPVERACATETAALRDFNPAYDRLASCVDGA